MYLTLFLNMMRSACHKPESFRAEVNMENVKLSNKSGRAFDSRVKSVTMKSERQNQFKTKQSEETKSN